MCIVSVIQHIKIGDLSQSSMSFSRDEPDDAMDEVDYLPEGTELGAAPRLSRSEERSLVRDSTASYRMMQDFDFQGKECRSAEAKRGGCLVKMNEAPRLCCLRTDQKCEFLESPHTEVYFTTVRCLVIVNHRGSLISINMLLV